MNCVLCTKPIQKGQKIVKHPDGDMHLSCVEAENKRIDAMDLEIAKTQEQIDIAESKDDFYKFCRYMDPAFFTDAKWHLKLAAEYMQQLALKEIPMLLVSMAPRAGKSYIVSLFHAWLIGKFPEDSSMRNSYAGELAEKFSYDIREMIQKPKYLNVFPNIKLKDNRKSINDWAVETARDSTYFCAGVGGAILGKGCRRCLPAGEMVYTNYGIMPIEKIYQESQEKCIQVLSYDHKDDIIRYNKVLDARRIISNEIVEITTKSGRVLKCTADHRVWNGQAYVEAGLLQQGERLYRPNVRILPQGIQTPDERIQETIESRQNPVVLFDEVCANGLSDKNKNKTLLPSLWERGFEEIFKVLFGRMQKNSFKGTLYKKSQKACSTNNKKTTGYNVPDMQCDVQAKAIYNKVLLTILRGYSTFKSDKRKCESKLSRCQRKVESKQESCIRNKRQGRLEMFFVWLAKNVIDSPFGRKSKEQYSEQFNNALQNMPCSTPQIAQDIIKGVRRIHGEIPVYDIQVDRDSNFFASDLLVHNCATLDDPIKNIEAAMSETIIDAVWNWYTSTHVSRMESGCSELHVATRWSRRDPIGRIIRDKKLEQIEPFVYRCGKAIAIVIPALIDGKSFCEEIHTTEEYLYIKSITEDFIWEAEYMQNPIESKGLLFPVEELKRFSLKEIDGKSYDAIIGFTDTADEGTDYLSSPVGKKIGEYTYITDVVFTQDPIEITEPLVAQQIIDSECELMKVESNSGGKSFALNVEKLIKGKSTCDVVFEPQTANKETRILMNAGYIKKHFWFREDYAPGSDYDHFMRALTSYVRLGKNKHDDAPDSVTGLAEYVKLLSGKAERKKPPVGYYTDSELQDKGYKPYEIKQIKKTMCKPWERVK